ncbi:MAG TPA: UDP-N-acetylmuramoyl-L-alanyl-D-glutamate--2,6-diaminopimelate ligase [Bacillota bacterium]|nr:UDP-N-acetylmuramoyl-L-alanyl-D-glutamate--2,6-diaminopimelate ligase [Bacillota bacterium]
MNLRELLSSLYTYKHTNGDLDIEIKGIETDSRKVKPGYLFVAVKGYTVDGYDFIPSALSRGAVAVLGERTHPESGVSIEVKDIRRALALLADRFYGQPTQTLKAIGVTGTNGKTTITHLVEKILTDYSLPTGIIGTIQMRFGEYQEEVKNTTPEALDLQRMFAYMEGNGATHACIEVSSHALEMGRVWGCNFGTAIFTNLTQDHLDYHHTMENYRFAKSLLFSGLGNAYHSEQRKVAILNIDDAASTFFRQVTAAEVITYGIDQEADVRAVNVVIHDSGTNYTLETYLGSIDIEMKMVGKFSVYNALAATAACLVEGVPLESIKQSLESIGGVRGRFERVDVGQNFTVIVDYAHTPDSLENVLKTAQEFVKGKIYCIVGCGGDRDRTKRPIMARIALNHADFTVFTSDNPRSEDPNAIIEEMVAGVCDQSGRYISIVQRKEAIEYMVSIAEQGDCIIIAGKGHETYQIIKDQVLPFDDKEIASVAILNRIK